MVGDNNKVIIIIIKLIQERRAPNTITIEGPSAAYFRTKATNLRFAYVAENTYSATVKVKTSSSKTPKAVAAAYLGRVATENGMVFNMTN